LENVKQSKKHGLESGGVRKKEENGNRVPRTGSGQRDVDGNSKKPRERDKETLAFSLTRTQTVAKLSKSIRWTTKNGQRKGGKEKDHKRVITHPKSNNLTVAEPFPKKKKTKLGRS